VWADLCVRYVIGIAANLSGDFSYAERLYLLVEEKIRKGDSQPVFVQLIARDLPKHLIELYHVWRNLLARDYAIRRSNSSLNQLDDISKKLLARNPGDYGALLSKAMCDFVIRRDVTAAKECIKGCEKQADTTWRYSLAFLVAYGGDLRASHDEYRRAFKGPVNDITVPIQCEEFIHMLLAKEPEKTHLLFCTALINYNAKQDFIAAKRDFEQFLASSTIDAHSWAKQIAEDLLPRCTSYSNAAQSLTEESA
jgi:hypothetical protein